MKIKILSKNGLTQKKNIADAMVVAGRVRFSNYDQEQDSIKGGNITEVESNEPVMIVVKNGDESITFPLVNYAGVENESVYISGNSIVEKIDGKIARSREVKL